MHDDNAIRIVRLLAYFATLFVAFAIIAYCRGGLSIVVTGCLIGAMAFLYAWNMMSYFHDGAMPAIIDGEAIATGGV